jgi:hypothetical protein
MLFFGARKASIYSISIHCLAMFTKWFKQTSAGSVPASNPTEVTTNISNADRKLAALFGVFVADAVAMPVHWMYNLNQLQKDYGRITGYVKPNDKFEGNNVVRVEQDSELMHQKLTRHTFFHDREYHEFVKYRGWRQRQRPG